MFAYYTIKYNLSNKYQRFQINAEYEYPHNYFKKRTDDKHVYEKCSVKVRKYLDYIIFIKKRDSLFLMTMMIYTSTKQVQQR